jgi:hypothetical protein
MLRTLAARATLAAASLTLVLTGCTRDTDFSITKKVDVTATGGVPYGASAAVDLAAEAPGAWRHRSRVKSLDVVGLDATLTENVSGNTSTGGGTIQLSRNGRTLTVGSWTNHTIPLTPPDSIDVALDPAGSALVMDALENDGKFSVLVTGTTSPSIHFKADVTLHLHMTFKVP